MNRPEFFKIYIPEESSEMMEIPKQFMYHLEGENCSFAYLTGPGGEEWQVGLARCKNEGFLVDGWKDFIKDNYVTFADLLLFKYEGNLRFNLNIFRPSGCESEDALRAKSSQGKKNSVFVQGGRLQEGDCHQMFFKVFVPEHSLARMLVPIGFVEENMKGEKSNHADLVARSGKKWRVDFVFKREKGWFFDKGWELFLKDNGISPFDFLVFKYVGNMEFDVKMFEEKGCEKSSTLPSSTNQNLTKGVKINFEKRRRGRRHGMNFN